MVRWRPRHINAHRFPWALRIGIPGARLQAAPTPRGGDASRQIAAVRVSITLGAGVATTGFPVRLAASIDAEEPAGAVRMALAEKFDPWIRETLGRMVRFKRVFHTFTLDGAPATSA